MRKEMNDLVKRTKAFALDVVRLCGNLPRSPTTSLIVRQLIRSATSVGANYRAACRAKSRADFIAKLSIVEEEADECIYWMELIEEIVPEHRSQLERPKVEADELVAIMVSSKKTARRKLWAFAIRNSSRPRMSRPSCGRWRGGTGGGPCGRTSIESRSPPRPKRREGEAQGQGVKL